MTVPDGVSPAARGLAEQLLASGKRQFAPSELRSAFEPVAPWSRGKAGRPEMLADAVAELRAAGFLRCSATTDDSSAPLPTRSRLGRPEPVTPRGRRVIWHPDLHAAAYLPGRPDERLLTVNDWLFHGGAGAEEIALRERAVDLGLDEKAFDRLGPVLTPAILRTYRPVPPLYRERLGDGPVLLVVENWTTFDSVRRALGDDPGPVGELGWGAGRAFTLSVLSLRDHPPATIRYFGDLDPEGLRIPAAASAVAEDEDLPPVRAATGLYELLLTRDKRGVQSPVPTGQAQDLADWLDPRQRDRVIDHLAAGVRLAQEAVNRPILNSDDAWLTTLATP